MQEHLFNIILLAVAFLLYALLTHILIFDVQLTNEQEKNEFKVKRKLKGKTEVSLFGFQGLVF